MNDPSGLEGYLHRLEAFRKSDIERETMAIELVKKYSELLVLYEQKCVDYDDAVESRRAWQAKATQSNRDLGEIQRASVSPFFFFFFWPSNL